MGGRSGANRAAKARGDWHLPADLISGLHPAVPEIVRELAYRNNDLGAITVAGLLLMLRTRRLGVTPADDRGRHYVVTGVRLWQIFAAAQARNLVRIQTVPVEILSDADSNERVVELCVADLLIDADLFALEPRTWERQRASIEKLLPAARLDELCGTPGVGDSSRSNRNRRKTRARKRSAVSEGANP